MDEIKSQEQNWISASLSTIGCDKTDSMKLFELINKSSQDDLITLGKYSLVSGLNENLIETSKIPNSLVSGIQYAEVYNSIPVKSSIDFIKDPALQSAIPSSLAVDNFRLNESDYRLTINAPVSVPNYLAGTGLYVNPFIKVNSLDQNFINNLSTYALSTNYISLSKTDQQFKSINDLHSIHKFGLFPNGSLDLITDHNHIADANLFASNSNFYIGSTDLGFISGSIISENNTPNYFENILETRLNSYKSDIANYIDARIKNKPTFITNYQIYIAANDFSLSDIENLIDLKYGNFRKELLVEIRKIIGKELRELKIELDKESLFADSFDIIPHIGPVIKVGIKAIKLINETKTIIM